MAWLSGSGVAIAGAPRGVVSFARGARKGKWNNRVGAALVPDSRAGVTEDLFRSQRATSCRTARGNNARPFRQTRGQAKGRASRPSEHRRLRAALTPIFRARKAGRQSHVELRVGLTIQHPNPSLVDGPELTIRPVGDRRAGGVPFRPGHGR